LSRSEPHADADQRPLQHEVRTVAIAELQMVQGSDADGALANCPRGAHARRAGALAAERRRAAVGPAHDLGAARPCRQNRRPGRSADGEASRCACDVNLKYSWKPCAVGNDSVWSPRWFLQNSPVV